MYTGEDIRKTPKGSRGISSYPKGADANNKTPKSFSGMSTKFQGFPDSRSENSDRNQSAR
jgi:hypothetical protein